MKRLFRKISFFPLFIFSFLFSKDSKAATSKDVTSRVNKIRHTLLNNDRDGDVLKLTGKDVSNQNLNEWVNWGNWANWNNWNNWRDWNNWGNWGNWRNY